MKRRIDPELLDSAPAEQAVPSLRDLVLINRLLGGHRVLLGRMRPWIPDGPCTILDVGAASGDAARALTAAFPNVRVFSMDLHPQNLAAAPQPRLVGDAFQPPFVPRTFDIVCCSLFLHHFEDDAIVRLLDVLASLAHRVLIVNDLERHWLPYYFVPWTRWLFGWASVTLHDAPVSIHAGFHAEELEGMAQRAGLGNIRVQRHLPWFRLSLVARR